MVVEGDVGINIDISENYFCVLDWFILFENYRIILSHELIQYKFDSKSDG